jgi:tetratricopeptide (TPR) repeat protein
MIRTNVRRITGVAVLAALTPYCAIAEGSLLGQIDFPNSGAEEAQADFIEGVLYLHNFEYDEAQAAFERARTIDKDFAMAYWGEAMTYNHPLWGQQAKDDAEKLLRKLGRSPKARAKKAPTQREKDYLYTVELLYGTVDETEKLPKDARDGVYEEAMRTLHETYPDDHEAATFYGLSILGGVKGGRNYADYIRAAAELTSVWDANRMHPGAAHYLIHSYDDPVHAPLGLPMARVYSRIAPSAAHAQHMVSHIFVAMGMWDDLITANEIAVRVENEGLDAEEERPITASHYVFWLEYGYLQEGRYEDAARLLETARARLDDSPKSSERQYYGGMYTRYLLDTEDWDAAERWAPPEGVDISSPNYYFARALADLKRGNIDEARANAEKVQAVSGRSEAVGDKGTAGVLRTELDALFALSEGHGDQAVELARAAVEAEAALAYKFGPPNVAKPSGELLGEVLAAAGQHAEAVTAYREQLKKTPLRANTLLGLARAAAENGDTKIAEDAYQRLAEVWYRADADVVALAEVRQATESVALGDD